MFYRYALYADDEYQGGIFRGIDCIDLAIDEIDLLLEPFDHMLDIPDSYVFGAFEPMEPCTFLFAERGHEKFAEPIRALVQAYEEHSLFEVRKLVVDPSEFADKDMPYNDGLQVAIRESVFDNYRKRKDTH